MIFIWYFFLLFIFKMVYKIDFIYIDEHQNILLFKAVISEIKTKYFFIWNSLLSLFRAIQNNLLPSKKFIFNVFNNCLLHNLEICSPSDVHTGQFIDICSFCDAMIYYTFRWKWHIRESAVYFDLKKQRKFYHYSNLKKKSCALKNISIKTYISFQTLFDMLNVGHCLRISTFTAAIWFWLSTPTDQWIVNKWT